jgi:hypothetical protein
MIEIQGIENIKPVPTPIAKKNQTPGKPSTTRKYVLLEKSLASWGKVPQQQQDLAQILSANMEIKEEKTEAEVFEILQKNYSNFPSLAKSVQDPTYLFKYYRGLKKDGKHAGFVARNFLQVVG